MSRIAYINGRYIRHNQASVSIDDRGYQFGDGIYEVVSVIGGICADMEGHLDRLEYSLSEVDMPMPVGRDALIIIIRHLISLNRITHGLVYMQVTRGVLPRNHAYPADSPPQLIMTAKSTRADNWHQATPIKVITTPDMRWLRRDIKTIQLLPNCLAKTQAVRAGADEAWMIDKDGFITEGASSTAWIITQDGTLITRPLSCDILRGITRQTILALAPQHRLTVIERAFTLAEALQAREAFITSASAWVTPVGQIDDTQIGNGGTIAIALRKAYIDSIYTKDRVG